MGKKLDQIGHFGSEIVVFVQKGTGIDELTPKTLAVGHSTPQNVYFQKSPDCTYMTIDNWHVLNANFGVKTKILKWFSCIFPFITHFPFDKFTCALKDDCFDSEQWNRCQCSTSRYLSIVSEHDLQLQRVPHPPPHRRLKWHLHTNFQKYSTENGGAWIGFGDFFSIVCSTRSKFDEKALKDELKPHYSLATFEDFLFSRVHRKIKNAVATFNRSFAS